MKHFTLPRDGGLITDGLPNGILHRFEKIQTEIYSDAIRASEVIADIIVDSIKDFEASNPGGRYKLGLNTGESMVTLFEGLVRRYREGKVSFKNVEVYATDEYYPISPISTQSHNYRLHDMFLDHVDVMKENIYAPNGSLPPSKVSEFCAEYEKKIRGLDLLVSGIGVKCQLAFNEPGSFEKSRTRTTLLTYSSIKRQSKNFNGSLSSTPRSAITIGVDTMMSAKRIILLAWGEEKAEAVRITTEGTINPDYTSTYLQKHHNITLFVDDNSGSLLTRSVAPWMVGPCQWSRKFMRKAVVWLCQRVNKPILKLTQQDYIQNYLNELLELYGPYDKVNIDVFNDLQHTISGWPGGKPNADDSTRPVKSLPFPKTVLIFSPHPDDDVISMGGTFIRLVEQGHNVHVAYETSGDLAVHDDVVMQHVDAACQLGYGDRRGEVSELIASKVPGEPEPGDLLSLKAAIRRSEARAADRSFGLNDDTNVHFLNLPFYESGMVTKYPRTQKDLDIIKALVLKVHPNQIYMAGDLADPHGTHRVCTEAALEAIDQLIEEGETWLNEADVWLYRGAWMEWELGRVDMAVPLSPGEVIKKRHAIYRHLSQKDIVPFPGDDSREFWQRSEDRTQGTAELYNKLGMAEYQAIEVFLKLR